MAQELGEQRLLVGPRLGEGPSDARNVAWGHLCHALRSQSVLGHQAIHVFVLDTTVGVVPAEHREAAAVQAAHLRPHSPRDGIEELLIHAIGLAEAPHEVDARYSVDLSQLVDHEWGKDFEELGACETPANPAPTSGSCVGPSGCRGAVEGPEANLPDVREHFRLEVHQGLGGALRHSPEELGRRDLRDCEGPEKAAEVPLLAVQRQLVQLGHESLRDGRERRLRGRLAYSQSTSDLRELRGGEVVRARRDHLLCDAPQQLLLRPVLAGQVPQHGGDFARRELLREAHHGADEVVCAAYLATVLAQEVALDHHEPGGTCLRILALGFRRLVRRPTEDVMPQGVLHVHAVARQGLGVRSHRPEDFLLGDGGYRQQRALRQRILRLDPGLDSGGQPVGGEGLAHRAPVGLRHELGVGPSNQYAQAAAVCFVVLPEGNRMAQVRKHLQLLGGLQNAALDAEQDALGILVLQSVQAGFEVGTVSHAAAHQQLLLLHEGRQVARVPHHAHRDLRGLLDHVRNPRVHGEPPELAAALGDRPAAALQALERLQAQQQSSPKIKVLHFGRVDPRQGCYLLVRDCTLLRQVQDHTGEVSAMQFRRVVGVELPLLLLVPQAVADARADAARSAAALVRRGPGYGHCEHSTDACLGVLLLDLPKTSVNHDAHTGHREGGLCDGRRENHLSPARGR
mmetsp:Transcript_31033/g.84138  ORF Transcript_31033/g.84138 Transcript_31033/m.84138 type:complete len:684 (-) Transcript_31033:69-2120(-)